MAIALSVSVDGYPMTTRVKSFSGDVVHDMRAGSAVVTSNPVEASLLAQSPVYANCPFLMFSAPSTRKSTRGVRATAGAATVTALTVTRNVEAMIAPGNPAVSNPATSTWSAIPTSSKAVFLPSARENWVPSERVTVHVFSVPATPDAIDMVRCFRSTNATLPETVRRVSGWVVTVGDELA